MLHLFNLANLRNLPASLSPTKATPTIFLIELIFAKDNVHKLWQAGLWMKWVKTGSGLSFIPYQGLSSGT